jgi:hypothetical protein
VRRPAPAPRLRLALTATLLVGAGVHAAVGVQHLPSNFGVLSILSAVVQLGLAATVTLRPSPTIYVASVVVSLVLVQLYLVNVTVGLPPVIAHTHTPGTHQLWGVTLASPAPVDGEGVVAKIVELASAVFGGLLGRSAR